MSQNLGGKVRALRRRQGMTQVRMAERLGISASYLNLIEHDKRPLSAALLIKLTQHFDVDLSTFAAEGDSQLEADLMEIFGDPMFDSHNLTNTDIQDLVRQSPAISRSLITLFATYRSAKDSAENLASRVLGQSAAVARRLPSEEVSDLIQRRNNHFPDLESSAELLWKRASFDKDDIYTGMVRYLREECDVRVRVVTQQADRAVRRYDPDRREIRISEVLAPRSRHFQIAHQIGLLTQGDVLDPICQDEVLTTDDSRRLARMVLANYFAGAVLMPYQPFRDAAEQERYDIELLGHRFRTSFEQVCHRLTTLQRAGSEGVPFHLIKIDPAGNVSKRFSASGIRFSRFGGACPRWNVTRAFSFQGNIRMQLSRMPDGQAYFCVARTLGRRHGGFRAPETTFAIGLGCRIEEARRLVYSEGIDLDNTDAVEPIGVTCRLCERLDCEQRAFPSLQHPLKLDENVRGVGFYADVD